jgi:nitroreductase
LLVTSAMASSRGLAAWHISPGLYPRYGTWRERLEFLLGFAVLAPSSHNTQPWQFAIDRRGIELFADRSRRLPVIDPHDRQLLMGCGAALYNLRLALLRFGARPEVELAPSTADPELVARLRPGAMAEPALHAIDLFDAIPHRHTNRQPFESRPVSAEVAESLASAADSEGAWLTRLHPRDKRAAADLIAAADREQFRDREFRRELARWLVADGDRRDDGLPGYAKSYGSPLSGGNTLLVRSFDLGGKVASTERELAEGSPMLAVLGTDRDEPAAWLAAGQAMQRVLLEATLRGLSVSFLNQALELDHFRQPFAELAQRGFPQLVLRFGYGPPAPATPRRSVAEVLRADTDSRVASG